MNPDTYQPFIRSLLNKPIRLDSSPKKGIPKKKYIAINAPPKPAGSAGYENRIVKNPMTPIKGNTTDRIPQIGLGRQEVSVSSLIEYF